MALQWRHNELAGVSNHQPHDCLFDRLFTRRSKKTSKLRVTGLCVGNSPVTAEFPAQRASKAENVSICWRHHGFVVLYFVVDMVWYMLNERLMGACGLLPIFIRVNSLTPGQYYDEITWRIWEDRSFSNRSKTHQSTNWVHIFLWCIVRYHSIVFSMKYTHDFVLFGFGNSIMY